MQIVTIQEGSLGKSGSLVVLPRCPDPRTGTGQRSLLLIDAAARQGPVHVALLAGGGPVAELEARDGVASVVTIQSDCVTKGTPYGGLLKLLAPQRAYAIDPSLQAALRERVIETGVRTVLFRYARTYCAAGLEKVRGLDIFVDVDDRDDQKYASRLSRMLGPALSRAPFFRKRIAAIATVLRDRLNDARMVWFTAPEDIWTFDRAQTGLVTNVPHAAPVVCPPVSEESRDVLFVGSRSHLPNHDGIAWFLRTTWPRVVAARPDARLRLVGVGGWEDLAPRYAHLDGVDFVGRVEDLAQEYTRARVCISPVREGGGSKIKIIEAASYGRPVISTGHALRGFGGIFSLTAVIANDPKAFADAILRYLDDAELAQADGAKLRAAQAMHYSRTSAIDRLSRDMSLALAPTTS